MSGLNVRVIAPDRLFYEGEVASVRAVNEEGEFEVLPQHAGMISTIREGRLVLKTAEGPKTLSIKNGFLEVIADRVTVLVDGVDAEQA